MCGEKKCPAVDGCSQAGSPPRVRGKACKHMLKLALERITPACAGKRRLIIHHFSRGGDHPRVCGEKSMPAMFCRLSAGSPPRVRGKATSFHRQSVYTRITPACAGKSTKESVWTSWIWDHPRVCGEKEDEVLTDALELGSPPRVRGKD